MNEPAPPPVTGQISPQKVRHDRLVARFGDFQDELLRIAPAGTKVARFQEVVMREMVKNPSLWECDERSVWQGVVESFRYGLELGVHCYLIPRRDSSRGGQLFANFQLGFKGCLELAHRADAVSHTDNDVVREGDLFDWQKGSTPSLSHKQALDPGRKERDCVAVWAAVYLTSGQCKFVVMSHDEIEEVRKASRAGSSSPWFSHWDEMAKKTALIRVLKTAPMSAEASRAVALDELAVAGKQDLIANHEADKKAAEDRIKDKESAEDADIN